MAAINQAFAGPPCRRRDGKFAALQPSTGLAGGFFAEFWGADVAVWARILGSCVLALFLLGGIVRHFLFGHDLLGQARKP